MDTASVAMGKMDIEHLYSGKGNHKGLFIYILKTNLQLLAGRLQQPEKGNACVTS